MTPREHPCDCDLTDDHGEAAELRRRFGALCREFRALPHGDLPADPWEAMRHTCDALEKAILGTAVACYEGHACPEGPHGSCCGQPVPAMEAEPVAFVVVDDGAFVDVDMRADIADQWRDDGLDVRPLYAHPQDAESLRGEVERLTQRLEVQAAAMEQLHGPLSVAALTARAEKAEAERDVAVQAERSRMMDWCAKRQKVSGNSWQRAARKALAGDMTDLRNRIDLIDAEPMDIVQSDAALTPQPDAGLSSRVSGILEAAAHLLAIHKHHPSMCHDTAAANIMALTDLPFSVADGPDAFAEEVAALRSRPVGEVWQDIATAPYDTPVRVRLGVGMTTIAILRVGASEDEDGLCDQWQAHNEGEHPECWSDGACWGSNDSGVPSMQPTHWMPLLDDPRIRAALEGGAA